MINSYFYPKINKFVIPVGNFKLNKDYQITEISRFRIEQTARLNLSAPKPTTLAKFKGVIKIDCGIVGELPPTETSFMPPPGPNYYTRQLRERQQAHTPSFEVEEIVKFTKELSNILLHGGSIDAPLSTLSLLISDYWDKLGGSIELLSKSEPVHQLLRTAATLESQGIYDFAATYDDRRALVISSEQTIALAKEITDEIAQIYHTCKPFIDADTLDQEMNVTKKFIQTRLTDKLLEECESKWHDKSLSGDEYDKIHDDFTLLSSL